MIEIVFQNEHFVLVNKPAGLGFHMEGVSEAEKVPGLVVLLQTQLDGETLFPVHRLDKMTSGLVLFALNKTTAQVFQRLFEQKEIEKYYLAIASEKPKKKQGWVKGDMLSARRGNWKLCKSQHNPAVTQFVSVSSQANERWFLLKPYTGKTHQLRVALKSLGAPIAGDERYQQLAQAKSEQRGYLHAYALRFKLYEQYYEFVCPPSEGERFIGQVAKRILLTWQAPWQAFSRNE